jgi:hypothetical protein
MSWLFSRAIAAARWEIADDTARLKRVLSIRECVEDERSLGWNEEAESNLDSAMKCLADVADELDDIRDEAH